MVDKNRKRKEQRKQKLREHKKILLKNRAAERGTKKQIKEIIIKTENIIGAIISVRRAAPSCNNRRCQLSCFDLLNGDAK